MTDVRIVNAEALTVGPDEILVVRVDHELDDGTFGQDLVECFKQLGLEGRVLVYFGEVEFTKIKRGDQP